MTSIMINGANIYCGVTRVPGSSAVVVVSENTNINVSVAMPGVVCSVPSDDCHVLCLSSYGV